MYNELTKRALRLIIANENTGFAALNYFSYATYVVFFQFGMMYVKKLGYTEMQIGIITAVNFIAGMIVQPVYGYLADKVTGPKKLLLLLFSLSVIIGTLLPAAAMYFVPLLLLLVFMTASERMSPDVVSSYAIKVSQKKNGLDFGFCRGFGSMGYAVTAIGAGFLIDIFGDWMILALHILLGLITVLIIRKLPDCDIQRNNTSGIERLNFFQSLKYLVKVPGFMITVAAVAFVQTAEKAASTFHPSVLLEAGGSSTHLGVSLFIMAIVEIPVMWNFTKLKAKFKLEHLLMFSFIVYILKIGLVAVFPTLWGVLGLQTLQAGCYAIFYPALILYFSSLVPEDMTASAMLLGSGIYMGVSGLVSSIGGGLLINFRGVFAIFSWGAVFCSIGALLFLTNLLLRARDNRKKTN